MSEFTHAFNRFVEAGLEPTVASPKGGDCQVTSAHPEDPINQEYFSDEEKQKLYKQTENLSDVKDRKFEAVYVVGGHGAMYDLPNNPDLQQVMRDTYENGGVLGAVCHGPAAFAGLKGTDGEYITKDKHINGFTNVEEAGTDVFNEMPFLLEDQLIAQGGIFEQSGPRQAHLTVDSRIVTGQNPESVDLVADAIIDNLGITPTPEATNV